VLPVAAEQTAGFGIVRVNDAGEVQGFVEKPKKPEQLEPVTTPEAWIERRGIRANGRQYLASMGIYLFKREALFNLLNAKPLATDFGNEIFPRSIQSHKVVVHLFDGYWEDVGTIKSYHEANLALTDTNPPFIFHTPGGVIFTRMRYLPASRVNASHLTSCLVSDGCVIGEGASITRCVLGIRTQIGKNVTLSNSVVIGADWYETEEEKQDNRRRDQPSLGIGDGSVIENAIVDKDARIGANVRIVNRDKVQEADGPNFVIREGVVVIPKASVVLDGTVI
jgi:glucose-1-phosphate adenylyltransferase